MPILNIQQNEVGQSGISPRIVRIETDDTVSTVTASGYVNEAVQSGLLYLTEDTMCLVTTKESSSASQEVGWFEASSSGGVWSLVPPANPGDVVLPTVANRIAHFTNTTGTLSSAAAEVVNAGNINAGEDGTSGHFRAYPPTANKGYMQLAAADNPGNFVTQIVNRSLGQSINVYIPDPSNINSDFVLTNNAGTQDILTGNLQVSTGNMIAGSDANAGYFETNPATTASGTLRVAAVDSSADVAVTISNADHAQATVVSIPDGGQATTEFIIADSAGTQSITSGNLQVDAGTLTTGSSGNEGSLTIFPSTASKGSFVITTDDNANDDTVTLHKNNFGQATTINFPDPALSDVSVLYDSGDQNELLCQQFVGLESILAISSGTWTVTRIAQGNYAYRHTAADETSIIGIDITNQIQELSGHGFELNSFDVIYSIGTLALDAHSVTLDRLEYDNNVPVSVNSIAITGTLATATQAQPYLTNVTIDTPAYNNAAQSKYVIEITVDNSATSDYDFYGINLNFNRTVA